MREEAQKRRGRRGKTGGAASRRARGGGEFFFLFGFFRVFFGFSCLVLLTFSATFPSFLTVDYRADETEGDEGPVPGGVEPESFGGA